MVLDNNAWDALANLVRSTPPDVSIDISFRKGTQAENMEGSSYDDDCWTIEGFRGSEIKYIVTDVYLTEELVEKARKKIVEKGLGW